jgi:hypothetical protein
LKLICSCAFEIKQNNSEDIKQISFLFISEIFKMVLQKYEKLPKYPKLLHSFVSANVDSCERLLFNAEGVADRNISSSATPDFM